MDPSDFQALAEELCHQGGAARLRSAVSRSYYAVYNTGAAALQAMGASLPRAADAHAKLEHCFNNSGDTVLQRVASRLAGYAIDATRLTTDWTNRESRTPRRWKCSWPKRTGLLGPSRRGQPAAIRMRYRPP